MPYHALKQSLVLALPSLVEYQHGFTSYYFGLRQKLVYTNTLTAPATIA
jgi:hypothetical protein